MDSLDPLLLGLLAVAALSAAFMAVRSRSITQQLEDTAQRLASAEQRARDAESARLAVQARFQGIDDVDGERDRLLAELGTLHRELRLQGEQRREAEMELAELQRRVSGLRAELAPLEEQAQLPLRPSGLADRPEVRR